MPPTSVSFYVSGRHKTNQKKWLSAYFHKCKLADTHNWPVFLWLKGKRDRCHPWHPERWPIIRIRTHDFPVREKKPSKGLFFFFDKTSFYYWGITNWSQFFWCCALDVPEWSYWSAHSQFLPPSLTQQCLIGCSTTYDLISDLTHVLVVCLMALLFRVLCCEQQIVNFQACYRTNVGLLKRIICLKWGLQPRTV